MSDRIPESLLTEWAEHARYPDGEDAHRLVRELVKLRRLSRISSTRTCASSTITADVRRTAISRWSLARFARTLRRANISRRWAMSDKTIPLGQLEYEAIENEVIQVGHGHLDPGLITALRHVTSLYETYAKGDVEQMGSDARARVESAREVLAEAIGELAGAYRVEGVAQG
ncbi:hypothetical protein OG225_42495 (plasmid) [Nocardia sp. NBC_01377]|uniref:hypothetical protein n=1 Tax=Nocardia sp. NBC_01377 TaxID=2903595 RepID=UPI002F917B4F